MEASPLAKLLQLAAITKDDSVLEVGCGTGYASALLSMLAGSVVALECDEALAAEARKNLCRLRQCLRRHRPAGKRLRRWRPLRSDLRQRFRRGSARMPFSNSSRKAAALSPFRVTAMPPAPRSSSASAVPFLKTSSSTLPSSRCRALPRLANSFSEPHFD